MKRHIVIGVLALLAIVPLAAQTPKGWMVRPDRSTSALDPDAAGNIKFVTMGSGFHATNPQAGVYWNPANTIKGNYSRGYHFKPRKLTVKRGTTVTWSWNSDAPHNVHVHGRKHHSRTDTAVKHFRLKFKHAGTFKYKCTVHGFKGKIVVVK